MNDISQNLATDDLSKAIKSNSKVKTEYSVLHE